MNFHPFATITAGVTVTTALALCGPPAAHACGGFFCNQQQPIDQTAEQILFSIGPDHVTALIQISYTGRAEDFAWIIPVTTTPEISVGTQAVFTSLAPLTQPSFQLQWSPEVSGCFPRNAGFFGSADGGASGDAGAGPGVQVIAEQEVGPYKTAILASDDADALIAWLSLNGYDQPDSSTPLIRHYVDLKMEFVALKLKRGAVVGDIRPLVLDMDTPEACVPLILTRIAAQPNLPILIYVLGDHRAVPRNWFHVEVNQRKIDWMRGGQNYRQLATDAINEASGRGFVTEFAGPIPPALRNQLSQPNRYNLTTLRASTDAAQAALAYQALSFPFGALAEAQTVLRRYIPMPEAARLQGVQDVFFYGSISFFAQQYLVGVPIDAAAFAADLEREVIVPLERAQALLDAKPYLTRILSTVSPDEMTRDPFFHMNPDLPNVTNVHVATGTGSCNRDNGTIVNTKITLPSGDRVLIGTAWSFFAPPPWNIAASEPDAEHIALVGATGEPTFYSASQAATADKLLDMMPPEAVRAANIPDDSLPAPGIEPMIRRPSNLQSEPPTGWKPGTVSDGVTSSSSSKGCSVARAGDGRAGDGALICLLALLALRQSRPRARRVATPSRARRGQGA